MVIPDGIRPENAQNILQLRIGARRRLDRGFWISWEIIEIDHLKDLKDLTDLKDSQHGPMVTNSTRQRLQLRTVRSKASVAGFGEAADCFTD